MSELRRGRRSYRDVVESDLEVLPLMNLFIVLIPMLLLSAVFVEIATIDMSMPSQEENQPQPETERLGLAVRILDDSFVVEGKRLAKRIVERAGGESMTELGAVLAEIAGAHPDQRDVQIISEPHTRYEEIIEVMDVARTAGLPQVALVGATAEG